ncbi:ABC transporter permease [candidate division KSB1 bacterium]|nr:ABC transporter permease [candidate division KSB1 bacterium]
MSYEFFISQRYLYSMQKSGYISLITLFSIGGILVGVAALIITLGIMNGFETEVRSRIIGFDAHIRLFDFDKEPGLANYPELISEIKQIDRIKGCAPFISEICIIRSEKPKTIVLKGVNLEAEAEVSKIKEYLVAGEFNFGEVPFEGDIPRPGILLGRGIADRLVVDIWDKVRLISPVGLSITGGPVQEPATRQFRVTGIFESGLSEYDSKIAYIGIEEAQDFLKYGGNIGGIEIKLDDYEDAQFVADKIIKKLGPSYTTETWLERNKTLFSSMQLEKWGAFIVLSLIILVAAFNIISTLIMMVLEKNIEIGILKAMGASSKSIMKIFLFHGLIVGVIGTTFGSILGYLACWSQIKFQWFSLPSDLYFIKALPVELQFVDFISITLASLLISILASIYPAWKASRLEPVEAIRYE